MSAVNSARTDRIKRRTGHHADDPDCVHYAGDYSGINWNATCKLCSAPQQVAVYVKPSWLRRIWAVLTGG